MEIITKSPDRVVNCISYNPNENTICIGANRGYKIFILYPMVKKIFITCNNIDRKDVYIAEVIDMKSRVIGIVNRYFPKSLIIARMLTKIHHSAAPHREFIYTKDILSVKSNSVYFVTCLEDSICIHITKDISILHSIKLDLPNFTGLFSLSERCVAYPRDGLVMTLLLKNMNPGLTINAHKSPIVAMILTREGDLIATASERGTTIRLFDTVLGTKLKEFRYGARDDIIYSLSFSEDNAFIICSTNGEIVPVFKIGSTVSTSGGEISEESAFATATLPISGQKTITALKYLELVVVSFEEVAYCYTLDPLKGGDCKPSKRFLLDNNVGEFARKIENDETIEGFVYVRKPENEKE